MADPEIFIVSRLNDCFGLDLTLVDFDEKAPGEQRCGELTRFHLRISNVSWVIRG